MNFDDYRSQTTKRPGEDSTRMSGRQKENGFRLPSQQHGKMQDAQNPNCNVPKPYKNRPRVPYTQTFQRRQRFGIRDFFQSFSYRAFPWRQVIIGLIAVLSIVLLIVFRNAITEFLNMLLRWAMTIGAIALILWLVFRRRRRW